MNMAFASKTSFEGDQRWQQAMTWVESLFDDGVQLVPLADDASFRRYFRVLHADKSYVLMDAPPSKEDIQPFLDVRQWMADAGVHVPSLYQQSSAGFLLLEDFGDQTWAKFLLQGRSVLVQAKCLMPDAMQQLHCLRQANTPLLQRFDVRRMHQECDLYLQWYLPQVAGIQVSEHEAATFHAGLDGVLQALAALPVCPVHLDYHSRNLMVLFGSYQLGVIDFQDAVRGPVTYDIASILYDCYQDYPESQRLAWSEQYFNALESDVREYFHDMTHWHTMLRLTAFQRHIKAIGIFSRLAHRDNKPHFLDEIPLTRQHLLAAMPLFDLPTAVTTLLNHQ